MSLPKYQNWKNKKLYTEMQAGSASPPQPYIPSTERNMVGNQLRTPEPTQQPETSRDHSTAPSEQSGGPVRSDTSGWYQDILDKFQSDLKKPSVPEPAKGPLGDMGMSSVGKSTFGKDGDPTAPGETPLVSQGVPVTDIKGRFESNLNKIVENAVAPPIGINPAAPPPAAGQEAGPADPTQMMGKAAMNPIMQQIMKKLGQLPLPMLKMAQQYLPSVLHKMVSEKGNESQADALGRKVVKQVRGNVTDQWS